MPYDPMTRGMVPDIVNNTEINEPRHTVKDILDDLNKLHTETKEVLDSIIAALYSDTPVNSGETSLNAKQTGLIEDLTCEVAKAKIILDAAYKIRSSLW